MTIHAIRASVRHGIAYGFALILSGCAEIPLGEGLDPATIGNRADSLDVSDMTRDEVIAQLGEPWIADRDRQVDVFRVSEKQHNLMVILLVPVPAPSSRYTGYTLVSYGANGRVNAADSSFSVETRWTDDPTAAGSKPLAVAGDYAFLHPWIGGSSSTRLSVTHARWLTDRGDDARAQQSCTLLTLCTAPGLGPTADAKSVCWNEVAVDGQKLGYTQLLNLWITLRRLETEDQLTTAQRLPDLAKHCAGEGEGGFCSFRQYLSVPLRLPPGTHRLAFTNRHVKGGIETTLECAAGDVWYAMFTGGLTRQYSTGEQFRHGFDLGEAEGKVELSRELPADRPPPSVLLYLGDQTTDGKALEKDH